MRPMDDAAPLIPLILAVELDGIARLERADAAREIDIVRDQHCLPGRQPNDEALMATAFVVVGEDFGDAATALNLNVATAILECRCQGVAGAANGSAGAIPRARAGVRSAGTGVTLSRKEPALRGEIHGRERNRYGNDPFHCPTQ